MVGQRSSDILDKGSCIGACMEARSTTLEEAHIISLSWDMEFDKVRAECRRVRSNAVLSYKRDLRALTPGIQNYMIWKLKYSWKKKA